MSRIIQQRFLHLLHVTSTLFTAQHGTLKEERAAFDGARSAALALQAEAKNAAFEPFLAYALGVTAIDGDYPLQPIRLTALASRVLANEILPTGLSHDDLTTAAYLADMGFRPAWLGQKGSHTEIVTSRIKEIGFPWFNGIVERLVLGHHRFEEDSSPHHCLSLLARYLALCYGMGTDLASEGRVSPSRALETLLQEFPGEVSAIKFLLKSLSAYPLGSWVALTNGTPALVIGANPTNPLRPKLGWCRKNPDGAWTWEEHSLEKEPTIHILGECAPSPLQLTFVNRPHLWIREWEGQGTFTDAEFSEIFRRHAEPTAENQKSVPGTSDTSEAWFAKAAPLPGDAGPSGSRGLALDVSDKELQKLRTDWETNVHQIEQCVTKLKSGLIESYRRENQRYRETLDRLSLDPPSVAAGENQPPTPPVLTPTAISEPPRANSTSPALQRSSPLVNEIAETAHQMQLELDSRQAEHTAQNNVLKDSLEKVRSLLEKSLLQIGNLPADAGVGLKTLLTKSLGEIDSAETGLFQHLRLPPASLNELQVHCRSAAVLAATFNSELQTHEDPKKLEESYQRQWRGVLLPQLKKWQDTVEQDWKERLDRWARLKQLVEQFQELTSLLKAKFPTLE